MALPEPASPATLERPRERALKLAARISAPEAVASDSYLGGFASGHRLSYSDAKQFVWWAPGSAPVTDGAGFGNGFDSGFEGGVGSPTGSGYSGGFSEGFR
jgi:hypothetical protein